jgi:hypothetical protein
LIHTLSVSTRVSRRPDDGHPQRWADEDAATAVGDRTVAARAIIRAALATTSAGSSPALALWASPRFVEGC